MNKFFFVVLIVFYAAFDSNAQQDRQLSSELINNLVQNPAFVGSNDKWNVGGVLREQWSGIDGSPSTSVFSFDMPFQILGTNHGFGIIFISDKVGDVLKQSTTSAALTYSYKYRLLGGVLSIGARASFINYTLKGSGNVFSGSVWDNDRNLLEGKSEETDSYDESVGIFDFSAGLLYKINNWYFGLSVNHLTKPSLFTKSLGGVKPRNIEMYYSRHFSMRGAYEFGMNSFIKLKPSFSIFSDLSSYKFTGSLSSLISEKLFIGLAYRHEDAVVISSGFQFKNGIKFGYSYDYGVSDISRMSDGSHELMMIYSFDVKAKKHRMSSVRFL